MKIVKWFIKWKNKLFDKICGVTFDKMVDIPKIKKKKRKPRKQSKYRTGSYTNEEFYELFMMSLPPETKLINPPIGLVMKFSVKHKRTLKSVQTKHKTIFIDDYEKGILTCKKKTMNV